MDKNILSYLLLFNTYSGQECSQFFRTTAIKILYIQFSLIYKLHKQLLVPKQNLTISESKSEYLDGQLKKKRFKTWYSFAIQYYKQTGP